jgi:hypothetical protein
MTPERKEPGRSLPKSDQNSHGVEDNKRLHQALTDHHLHGPSFRRLRKGFIRNLAHLEGEHVRKNAHERIAG